MGTHPIFESDFDCLTVKKEKVMGIVDRITLGGQRVTRKTINSFVGKNNFAWQELRPPSVGELTQGVQQIVTFPNTLITGRANIMGMTTTEAAQYALVMAEVYIWFCVGECIGKGSIIGYRV